MVNERASEHVTARPQVGMCFDRTLPASMVTDVARRLDGRADQLWIIEDCFYTAGVSLAASALTATERLTVGIGILPAVVRTAAVTAMEIATLCALAPGRLLPGIGHGVQSWMGQMGVRPASPLTALEEVLDGVRRLLDGEQVTMHGQYVHLDDVQLYHPPAEAPPLLAGVRGPKSLALAGRAADGVVLAEPASPSYVRWALEQAGHPGQSGHARPFHTAVFSIVHVEDDRRDAYRTVAPSLAGRLDDPAPELKELPFFADMLARYAQQGVDGLVTMPREWWLELGPIGTLDDAREHIDALEAAGVHSVGLFPLPDAKIAMSQVEHVVTLAAPGSR